MEELDPLKNIRKHSHTTNETKTVRTFFLIGGLLMLLTLPVVSNTLSTPIFISLFAILVVEFCAGFTAPMQRWVAVTNAVISAVALMVFEYLSIEVYIRYPENGALFWINQSLAVIFFFAFYYSIKVLRKIFTRM